jgi:hypothetical protein
MSQPAKPPSPRQVLLGLFILVQLAFLFTANVLGFVQWFPTIEHEGSNKLVNRVAPRFAEKQGHGWQWGDQLDGNLRRYTELTGQDQAWSLFAPTVSKATGFPAILLSWDEAVDEPGFRGGMLSYDATNGFNLCGPWHHPLSARQPSLGLASQLGVLTANDPMQAIALYATVEARRNEKLPRTEILFSPNEPADLQSYIRVSQCRVRRFEGNFYFNTQPYSYEDADSLGQRLTKNQDFILAYMRWRLRAWQKDHPDVKAPTQVILVERFFSIHAPDEPRGWDGPYVVPVARWLPGQDALKGSSAAVAFDFNELRFVP